MRFHDDQLASFINHFRKINYKSHNLRRNQCKNTRDIRHPHKHNFHTLFSSHFSSDIEVLRRKRQKIDLEIAQDEKNKEILAAQILSLQEKQEEIDERIAKKKIAYAKINDTLEQSDLGLSKIIDSMQVILSFAASKTENTDVEQSD